MEEENKSAELSHHTSISESSDKDEEIKSKDKSEEFLVEVPEVPQELKNDDPANAIMPGLEPEIDININNIIEPIPNSDSQSSKFKKIEKKGKLLIYFIFN